jgi:precorrin-3B C17-methyltransferase
VVGLGPGNWEHMTGRAREILAEAQVVTGYKTYIELIRGRLDSPGQEVISSGMTQEVDRCREVARQAAEGKTVALVSSGDAGIYGMAGIMLEVISQEGLDIQVEIVPGVSASAAAAACLGAPLMHDFVTVSLSDLLTPWELIKKRVRLAAEGDFVLAIYNPKSKQRITQIEEVRSILLEHRSPDTPVGIVRNALREGQEVCISTLAEFTKENIDMLTTVIVGNSQSRVLGEYMVTPRGYRL